MADVLPFHPADEDAARNRARRQRPAFAEPTAGSARVLPHSLEAEEFLLSLCLLDGDGAIGAAYAAGVRAGTFYEPKHGMVWGPIEKLWHLRKPVDVGMVAEELKESRELEVVGGYAFLTQVSKLMPTSAQVSHWIEKVVELAELRKVIREATAAVEKCYGYSGGGVGNDPGLLASLDRLQEVRVRSQRDLPAIVRDEELGAMVLPEPPMLIDKVLHRGRRTLLLAPSKASKTWTAMHISVAIASGSPWLGFKTHQAPVLHIDLELPTWDLKKRRNKLREMLGLQERRLDVDWWSLDGYQRSIDELMPLIAARAPLGKFGMIVIEPAYVILGKRDENDNADVTDFMNRLAWLARLSGAAVLCTHHFAKGDASKKEAKDRASGAGAWVRAPDTAITLTPLAEEQGEDCYSMEFIERSMKRHAPIGVQFEYPVFRTRDGLDLNALREAGRPRESTEKNIVELLEGKDAVDIARGLSFSKIMALAEAKGMSRSTAKRRLEEAVDVGRVQHVMSVYFAANSPRADEPEDLCERQAREGR